MKGPHNLDGLMKVGDLVRFKNQAGEYGSYGRIVSLGTDKVFIQWDTYSTTHPLVHSKEQAIDYWSCLSPLEEFLYESRESGSVG